VSVVSKTILTILTLIGVSLIISIIYLCEQKNLMAIPEIITHKIKSNNSTSNLLSNQQNIKILDTEETLQMKKDNKNQSSITNQVDFKKGNTIIGNNYDNDSFRKFQHEFCGLNAEANYNIYVTEYVLPQACEMPLGIAFDYDAKKVWYASTKNGVLGSYNIKEKRFDQEHIIPEWSPREDSHSFSQIWDMKVNGKTGDVWFTDEKGNAIWRFIKSSQKFEIYKIPGSSQYFGTTYPISMEFASDDIGNNNDDIIFFVGTYSESLWYANIAKLKNGTSEGISQIALPVANDFKGIDPIYVTIGSLAYDSKRHDIWISVMAYSKKGYLIRYKLDTRTFNEFELPKEISSPLGMTVDPDSGDLWVTNAGTSIFYRFKSHGLNDDNNNISIVKFATSHASSRIFSGINGISSSKDNSDNIANISKHAYTLPYWIKKSGRSLWFNEWEGNKIARFDPSHGTLVEYWIPSQNILWGICSSFDNTVSSSAINSNNNTRRTCGIANVLQFSTDNSYSDSNSNNNNNEKAMQVWFTEWSENKIGKIDVSDKHLPFSVGVSSSKSDMKELTVKRGESEKINIKIKTTGSQSSFYPKDEIDNNLIHMIVSGTFTSTGDLGNSQAYFSKNSFTIDTSKKNAEKIRLIFTPSADLKPGKYTLMVGAENNAVSLLKAIQLNIT
jgi:virginiamycin B lyase